MISSFFQVFNFLIRLRYCIANNADQCLPYDLHNDVRTSWFSGLPKNDDSWYIKMMQQLKKEIHIGGGVKNIEFNNDHTLIRLTVKGCDDVGTTKKIYDFEGKCLSPILPFKAEPQFNQEQQPNESNDPETLALIKHVNWFGVNTLKMAKKSKIKLFLLGSIEWLLYVT